MARIFWIIQVGPVTSAFKNVKEEECDDDSRESTQVMQCEEH